MSAARLPLTPSQTIGPFFHGALLFERSDQLLEPGAVGPRIRVQGRVLDGAGEPVSDALLELWHADPGGRYRHPEDLAEPSRELRLQGFGRVQTQDDGSFAFETLRPGPVPAAAGAAAQAPHLVLGLFARGLLNRLVTRIYFDGDPANAADPVLLCVPAPRRATLLAQPTAPGSYRFDIALQGARETVFFDV